MQRREKLETGLFEALRKYSPREGKDPLENFITEGFAWLLNKYPEFGEFFLRHLRKDLSLKVSSYNCEWRTQANFDGTYPDMVCLFKEEKKAIVFEHKARCNTYLHENQINNYRKYAKANFDESCIVLITATKQQHEQCPDLALCWSDIYKFISDWEQKENGGISFLLKDFQKLLKGEGLGPPVPISHEAIRSYYGAEDMEHEAKDMERNLGKLIHGVKEREEHEEKWKKIIKEDYDLDYHGNFWGCMMGLRLLDNDNWIPGIFVGVLLNDLHYQIGPIDYDKGPDFYLLLHFDKNHLHDIYTKNDHYKELVRNLSSKVKESKDGWKFHHHLKSLDISEEDKKRFPIHIRKPLLDVFAGTESYEEQECLFYNAASELIKLVAEEESFWKLREYCKEQDAQR